MSLSNIGKSKNKGNLKSSYTNMDRSDYPCIFANIVTDLQSTTHQLILNNVLHCTLVQNKTVSFRKQKMSKLKKRVREKTLIQTESVYRSLEAVLESNFNFFVPFVTFLTASNRVEQS